MNLSACEFITDAFVQSLFTGIGRDPSGDRRGYICAMHNLTDLDLSRCDRITDEGFSQRQCQGGLGPRLGTNLKKLNLDHIPQAS